MTEVIIAVVAFAAMFIASVLLIIGLRKVGIARQRKKGQRGIHSVSSSLPLHQQKRHQYIAIWIGVTAVCIVLNLLRLIRSQRSMAQNLLTVGKCVFGVYVCDSSRKTLKFYKIFKTLFKRNIWV